MAAEHLIQNSPPIIVYGDNIESSARNNIESLKLGEGLVKVNNDGMDGISPRQLTCSILAATGASNRIIGDLVDISVLTVKSHMDRVYDEFGIASRAMLPRFLYANGLIVTARDGQSLGLTATERLMVDLVSQGASNKQIATSRARSFSTVKSQLATISEKSGWRPREAMGFAALLSGEIGNYTLRSVNVQLELAI